MIPKMPPALPSTGAYDSKRDVCLASTGAYDDNVGESSANRCAPALIGKLLNLGFAYITIILSLHGECRLTVVMCVYRPQIIINSSISLVPYQNVLSHDFSKLLLSVTFL